MTQVVWIDSRQRTSGTDSDFEISLRETIHLSDTRVRVDKLTICDAFFSTDLGSHLYFAAPGNSFTYVTVPEGAYTGFTLAAAIQQATNRACTYNVLTNSIVHTLQSADRPWLSDAELSARAGVFPANASANNPLSLNEILGAGVNVCDVKTTTDLAVRTTFCVV